MGYDPETQNDGDEFTYDFSAETGGHVPEGEYEAILCAVEKGFVKTDGAPKIDFTFFCLSGAAEGFKPRPLAVKLTPDLTWKLREVFSALGVAQAGQSGKVKRDDLIGRRCIIKLEDNTYQDQVSSQVTRVKPHPGGPSTN